MESMEDVDSESSQLDCLGIPKVTPQLLLPEVALRKVFENLSSADLRNLSLVNKAFNYETRSVLRDRGSWTAKMNTAAGGRCKDLITFASDLRRMGEVRNRKVVPFSGLRIAIGGADYQHGAWCTESPAETLDQALEDILRQMEWKHLALDLTGHWDRKEDCAGFQLVKKIFHSCSCLLEELSLKIYNREAFIQHFLQGGNFPRLITLKFQGLPGYGDEDVIKALVSRAPKLKVLCTNRFVDLRANVLEGSAAVHAIDDPLLLRFLANETPESAVGRLRVRNLHLGPVRENFNLQRFSRMMGMMLQTSRTTLSSLSARATCLVLLINYGIVLEHVRELDVILYDSDVSQPRARRLLKSFDFSRVFPNLSSVRISCFLQNPPNLVRVWNALSDMVEQEGNAALIEPANRTANIKKLSLSLKRSVLDSFTRFLDEMFPDIEKLSIETDVSFIRFWDYWLNLEELELHFIPAVFQNLDSTFCGIFPEEVDELRERDEEYLQNVHIVPVMPSLCYMKRLKTFRVVFDTNARLCSHRSAASMLSKVAGLVAFKRSPDLTVTLATNSFLWRRELQHMEPYASVQLTLPLNVA